METVTFEQLPSAVSSIYMKLENIERLLQLKNEPAQSADRWFDLDEFCKYHPDHPAKPTVYNLVARREVPHHKRGKKLYFLKSEIDAWLKGGRKKTVSELQSEADGHLYNRSKKGVNV